MGTETENLEALLCQQESLRTVIENARRYAGEQRRSERFALIARIGSIITADLHLEDLLQKAADAIHELLGYPNIGIPLIDPRDPETMVLRVFGGKYKQFMRGEYRLPLSQGIMGAAARSRTTLLVNDVAADPRYSPTPGAVGIAAELAVPILLGDRLLGILNVESGEAFSDEDAVNLKIIADQLAVAIENSRLFAEKQRALEETQSLYETSRHISTAPDVPQVIRAYLRQMSVWSRHACAVLLSHDSAHDSVDGSRWTLTGGIEDIDSNLSLPDSDKTAFLDSGRTVTIADVTAQGDFREIAEALQGRSLALIPLMAHGYRIGVVVLSCPHPYVWQDEDLRRHQAAATQLAMVIDSRRQQTLLQERGQQLAVLEERQRLARELHDSVTQLIFSTTLIAQTLGPAWQRDPVEGERRVQRLLELSRSALAEMRDLLQELKPAARAALPPVGIDTGILTIAQVRRHGLAAALKAQVTDAVRDGRKIVLDASRYQSQPMEQEEALFRITQEALSNAAKHARAIQVDIRLQSDGATTHLTITDDGIGFNKEALSFISPDRYGLGLFTMRERAESFGGTVKITSAPGQGTAIEVTLPAILTGENAL